MCYIYSDPITTIIIRGKAAQHKTLVKKENNTNKGKENNNRIQYIEVAKKMQSKFVKQDKKKINREFKL